MAAAHRVVVPVGVALLIVAAGWPMSRAAAQADAIPAADFYVAPDGDDHGPGTERQPFATLHRAQQAVRAALSRENGRDIVVLVRGGRYVLGEPLVFTAADAPVRNRVVFAAYPGEEPRISGGRDVTGWTRDTNDRWFAPLPEGMGAIRDLYAGNRRLPRARFPNGDEVLRVEAVNADVTEITLDTALPAEILQEEGAELVVLQNWSTTRVPVVRSEGTRVTSAVPAGWMGHGDYTTTSPGKPAFLEHARAFLDAPGEWWLDTANRRIHYVAGAGEDPNTMEIVAPALTELLVLRGEADAPVRNVTFRGIAFEHAAWVLPAIGYIGIQAGHYGTRTDAPTYVLPAAVEFRYAQDCRFEHSRVAHTGASGIALGPGCRDNLIAHSVLTDIGGTGIMVGRRDSRSTIDRDMNEDSYLAADWPRPADVPIDNEVAHNVVTRAGAVQFGAVGIFDAFSDGTYIHHNLVTDLPYTGISLGFRWDTSPTSQRAGRVEYNHIHDVMKLLADGGGIYTLGVQPEAVLRGNLIHDVHRSAIAHGGAPNNGIFFDQGSSAIRVEGTMIYATSGEPIRFNQTGADQLSWGRNYFGVMPGDPEFPTPLAAQCPDGRACTAPDR